MHASEVYVQHSGTHFPGRVGTWYSFCALLSVGFDSRLPAQVVGGYYLLGAAGFVAAFWSICSGQENIQAGSGVDQRAVFSSLSSDS